MKEKIGILCASDTELMPFLNSIHPHQTIKKAMLEFHIGRIGKIDAIMVYSGVCKVNAAIASQLLIDFFHVDAIINAGVAGGIDSNIQLFDTIISERMVYHDVSDDILTEYHPWLESNYFFADPALLAIAREYSSTAMYPVLFGTMATGEQFIDDENRDKINQKYAPLSVDMETTSIAHVCHVNRIPFLSVRTITDTSTHKGMENFEKNCEVASEISAGIALGILSLLEGK
ncbi:5'-methylthioadenosine/S-adenosylhomocysteine nucleosidase [Coprobacter tertius]|uniref:adenosylhomocysteine nucleosidase n=1 Tax=Coprobacter tertius TaxID=2944915 RepID=A0ABT1MHP2_9BACT|nr:5'-methylthioadenosine/S-adenosylhomocysteine nucleosidase [Coprobacter tertius]MCP9611559.1 5'-methylthioadenosine/S-adenosylhomocysteine nucleosidase [Coprobacter tertius]